MLEHDSASVNKEEFSSHPQEKVEAKVANTCVIQATPVLTAEQLDSFTNGADAVVLIAFATGTVPQRLIPVIESRVNSGVPVFLLSSNYGDSHGILKIAYEPQVKAAAVGAVALEKVNVNNIEEVVQAIKEEFSSGKKGNDLANTIERRFKYGDNEEKPKPEWDR